ncbi:hypothetical protein [Mesorhizobium loti]|nr:hypothetical protein [Mesorhizobium loti]
MQNGNLLRVVGHLVVTAFELLMGMFAAGLLLSGTLYRHSTLSPRALLIVTVVSLLIVTCSLWFQRVTDSLHSRQTLSAWTASSFQIVFPVFITIISVSYFSDPQRELKWSMFMAVYTIIAWTTIFHNAARFAGPHLSAGIFGEWFAKAWVKCIDYIYLTVSALGVLRLAISGMPDDLSYFNAVGVVAIGVGLGLRLTKTSIEIFGWDKPPANHPPTAQTTI